MKYEMQQRQQREQQQREQLRRQQQAQQQQQQQYNSRQQQAMAQQQAYRQAQEEQLRALQHEALYQQAAGQSRGSSGKPALSAKQQRQAEKKAKKDAEARQKQLKAQLKSREEQAKKDMKMRADAAKRGMKQRNKYSSRSAVQTRKGSGPVAFLTSFKGFMLTAVLGGLFVTQRDLFMTLVLKCAPLPMAIEQRGASASLAARASRLNLRLASPPLHPPLPCAYLSNHESQTMRTSCRDSLVCALRDFQTRWPLRCGCSSPVGAWASNQSCACSSRSVRAGAPRCQAAATRHTRETLVRHRAETLSFGILGWE